jgi:ribosomal protein L32
MRPGREKPEAYKCKNCGHYHIAHKKKHHANRKSLGRYLAERKKYFEGKKPCSTT